MERQDFDYELILATAPRFLTSNQKHVIELSLDLMQQYKEKWSRLCA